MEAQWWFVFVVAVIVVAIIAYWRSSQSRDRRDQDRRMDVQAEGRARTSAAEISEREDRRLAGMTVEDRAWEQASLQRQRATQERLQRAEIAAEPDLPR